MASTANSPSDLYERDYCAWLQAQVRAMRERRIEDVDWENVAEEIDGLSRSEKRGIKSHMAVLVKDLLKVQYTRGIFREFNARGWRVSVRSARRHVNKLLGESPSLRPQLAQMLIDAYEDGRLEALRARGLSEDVLPETCPWAIEQVIDEDFLPG